MVELWDSLRQLVFDLGHLLVALLWLAMRWSLLIAWLAWWLWGVNWKKAWTALALGAWAAVVLLMLVSAFVWSRLEPGPCECLPGVSVPNFWWQLGSVSLLVALTLLCGWLQGVLGWTPAEVNLEPPPGADHGHHH